MSASIKETVSPDQIMQLCHTDTLFMPLFLQVMPLLHLNDSVIVNVSHDEVDGRLVPGWMIQHEPGGD